MRSTEETASSKQIYELYLLEVSSKIQHYQEEKSNIEKAMVTVHGYIKRKCSDVYLFDGVKIEDLVKRSFVAKKYIQDNKNYYDKQGIVGKDFMYLLAKLDTLKQRRYKIMEYISKLEKYIINQSEFSYIVKNTMKLGLDSMINEGANFSLHAKLGYFKIASKKNKPGTRVVNQFETRKLKKELIEQGIQIRTKDNPNGRNYLVYFLDSVYYRLKWFKNHAFLYDKRIKNYMFKSVEGDNCISKKIYDKLKVDPNVKVKYNYDYHKSRNHR